jgi:hypothetical protein
MQCNHIISSQFDLKFEPTDNIRNYYSANEVVKSEVVFLEQENCLPPS